MAKGLTERDLDRRINGRLRRWAEFRRSPRYPAAGISGAYRIELPDRNRLPTSQQERWLLRHKQEIKLSIAIETGLKRMTDRQRLIIFRRYFLHETWNEIAQAVAVNPATVYRDRRAAFRVLSDEFGWEAAPKRTKAHRMA